MVKRAIHILDNKNLDDFKAGALARAKEFDVNAVLPIYEDFYQSVLAKHQESLSNSF